MIYLKTKHIELSKIKIYKQLFYFLQVIRFQKVMCGPYRGFPYRQNPLAMAFRIGNDGYVFFNSHGGIAGFFRFRKAADTKIHQICSTQKIPRICHQKCLFEADAVNFVICLATFASLPPRYPIQTGCNPADCFCPLESNCVQLQCML